MYSGMKNSDLQYFPNVLWPIDLYLFADAHANSRSEKKYLDQIIEYWVIIFDKIWNQNIDEIKI